MSYGSMETRGVDEEKETTTRVEEQERELNIPLNNADVDVD